MSTVSVTNLKNASSSVNNAVTTSGGDLTNAAGVSFMSANKNLLYNGAMQVAQRGTSTAGITSGGYYTADRWGAGFTGGTWTQDIQADAPSGTGLRNSLRFLCTTAKATLAAADWVYVTQALEGQDVQRIAKGTSSAQPLTLSFWVKSNVTGTYTLALYDFTNNRGVNASYTISASATWERKTVTLPADTTGVITNNNAAGLSVAFTVAAGSNYTSGTLATTWATYSAANQSPGQTNLAAATNNYWQITGVQLEVGPVATSFEFKSYGQELRECQRYYYVVASGLDDPIGIGAYYSATNMVVNVQLPVTMRGVPTLSATSGTDYYTFSRNSADDAFNSLAIWLDSATAVTLRNTTEVSGTAGQAGSVRINNASGSIALSSEL